MPHRKVRDLVAPIMNDPERWAKIEVEMQALRTGDALSELMNAHGLMDEEGNPRSNAAHADMLCLERSDDRYLDTLRRYIEELGGRLEVTAVFPSCRVSISAGASGEGDGC